MTKGSKTPQPNWSGYSENAKARMSAPAPTPGSKATHTKAAQRERQLERTRTEIINQAWMQRVLKR